MSHIESKNINTPIVIFTESVNQTLCANIKQYLKKHHCSYYHTEKRVFQDLELNVVFPAKKPCLDKKTVYILHSGTPNPNKQLVSLSLLISTIKKDKVKEINVIYLYPPYTRSESPLLFWEMINKQVNKTFCIHMHSPTPQTNTFEHWVPYDLWKEKITELNLHSPILIAPDKGIKDITKKLATQLGCKYITFNKKRTGQNIDITIGEIPLNMQDRPCVIIDDIICSGNTIITTAKTLEKFGASPIYACVTHNLLPHESEQRIITSPIKKLFISDSTSIPTKAKIETVSLAKYLIQMIK